MPRHTRWRDLVPGVVAVAVLTAIVVGVLLFARVGALRGDTIRLVVLAGSARELLTGSEVWIAGQKVGAVHAIDFRSAATGTDARLAITIDVLEAARPQLRADTYAELKVGGSLLGAPILSLAGGSPDAPPLESGDTIRARTATDPQTLAAGFAGAGRDLPELRANIAGVLAGLRDADGTLGAALRGGGGFAVGELATRVGRLGGAVTERRGTLGRLLAERGPLRQRVAGVQASADSLLHLLESSSGTYGRFQRDSTLVEQVTEVRDEIAAVRALIDLPAGTAGRLVHDAVLVEELAALQAQLDLLIADVKARPFRYIVF